MEPTYKDIARAAGVSVACVSLALRNSPRISATTRQRVQDLAGKMGYKPNPMQSAWQASVRSRQAKKYETVLACVNTNDVPHFWSTHPWGQQFYNGLARRASDLGYLLEEFDLTREFISTPEKLAHILLSRGINGLLVPFPTQGKWMGAAPFARDFSMVIIGQPLNSIHDQGLDLRIHRVLPDAYGNARLCARKLCELGYRHAGVAISDWQEDKVCRSSRAALLSWHMEIGLEKWAVVAPECHYADVLIPASFKAWLKKERPDVIICQSSFMKGWLEQANLRVPQDIGLVHLHLGIDEQGWSGIDVNHDQLAVAAVDLLTAHLLRNELGPAPFVKQVSICGRWVQGKTVRGSRKSSPARA